MRVGIWILLLFLAVPARCQETAPTPAPEIDNIPSNQAPEEAKQRRSRRHPVPTKPLSFYTSLTTRFDSNIDHQPQEAIADEGVTFGFGTTYSRRFSAQRLLQVDYELGTHSYAQTNKWDRLSHNGSISLEQRLSRLWSLESIGEVSLKGSSEDRELSDQYIVLQRLNYRLSRRNRLRLFGAYRLKRYNDNGERDSVNRFVGMSFRQRLGQGDQWQASYRYEANRAKSPRNHYLRWTYDLDYLTGLGKRDTLGLGLTFRPRQYERRIKVSGTRVPRRDNRWIFSAAWTRPLRPDLELRLGYGYETQDSNDPDKVYNEHLVYTSVIRHW